MFEILIDKQIGNDFWAEGITPDYVRKSLASAPEGEEIRITIDSPGGSVWDCITIYNIIRDFCRNHKNKITTYIQGMAASAASVIAMAAHDVSEFNEIVVEDNSVFMIHNAWTCACGNKNELRQCADDLEGIDAIAAGAYSRKTSKELSNIKNMMDKTTWLYGQEIIDEGFATSIILDQKGGNTDKQQSIASAQNIFNETQNKMHAITAKQCISKIAACISTSEIPGKNKPDNKIMEGCKMTVEELKNSNPDVYTAILAEGEKAGVQKERDRADSLLKMGELAGCPDVAANFIRQGSAVADNKVQEQFFEKRIAKTNLDAQTTDEAQIPEVVTPKDNDQVDDAAVMAAFDKETGAK